MSEPTASTNADVLREQALARTDSPTDSLSGVIERSHPDLRATAPRQGGELESGVLDTALAYGREQLAGLETLELPTDRPRPALTDHQGARERFTLPKSLVEPLERLAHDEGATLFMLLLAAFQVLLMRHSGQRNLAVGIPASGPTRTDRDALIGSFCNTLVLRSDLGGNPSFIAVLQQVLKTSLDAFAHQDLVFDKLVAELRPQRELSRDPLCQVYFELRNPPAPALDLDGLKVQPTEPQTTAVRFDLSLLLTETDGELHGEFVYATQLFDAATIARMAGHFATLLEGIAADPARPIEQLSLLGAAERHQLLVEWNDTAVDDFRDHCIHQLFEDQVARTPQAVALVFEDRELSYAEVNARANQLAHVLRASGVGAEVRVGVFAERSPEMVLALLAVLKAGGAYVPLDPSYPQQRLLHMLEDAQVAVVLVQPHLLDALPASAAHSLLLEGSWAAFAGESTENLPLTCAPHNLAYVIFTSGSTGRPKGVMNEHGGVCNLLLWLCREYALSSDDRVLQKTPFSFDVSVWEFFCPLIAGARLVLARPDGHRDSAYLACLIRDAGITTLHFVPSMLQVFMEAYGFDECRSLKRVFCGGEALPWDLLERFFARFPGLELHNHYGPTEAAVDATFWACRPGREDRRVPIGRPLANTRTYILDARGQPVPVGVSGELHIGGVQVARGYLNRPELTAERFVADPFSADAAARLYRTGDLARYLPDGNIDFLGRIDHQVKLRGFRIELGEIEAVLMRQPQLREAVVLLREDTPGDPRLVAYVVPALEMPTTAELRAALKAQLPEHMIPTAFVPLSALPLTASGKADRKALPAPVSGEATPAADSCGEFEPRSRLEQSLVEVWRDILQHDRIGIHDSFFDLGGHSLLAIRLISRLRTLCGVELPVRVLFDSPTIAALALRLGPAIDAIGQDGRPVPVPVPAQPRSAPMPLSFAQQRLWFLDRLLPGRAVYNIALAWRVLGELDTAALVGSLDFVVARHEMLRTRIVPIEDAARQVIDPASTGAMTLTDLRALAPAEREHRARQIANADAVLGFDLAAGPVFRARLLRLADDDHWLLLNVHHIAADGWSMGVLRQELSSAYEALAHGRRPPWPALPIQYADYALWQRARPQAEVHESQLAYWHGQLAGLSPLELPTDRPRPAVQSYRGSRQPLALSAQLTQALTVLSHQRGATLYMTLLAAFQVLLMRHSGQADISVGSPIAGRGRSEFDGLIGFFVNTLVMRTDLSGNPSFVDFLGRVRDVALNAYEHQDMPFDRLVEALMPERDLGRSPLFQVMFVLQNAPPGDLELPGLQVLALATETGTAKFDLLLSLSEENGALVGDLEYASDLFDAETIARMTDHLATLLEGIVADPMCRIGQLPLLSPGERHQLLVEWNDTAIATPELCVHRMFEAQAARTPDAVAVVFAGQQLTYAGLNARANQLAHHLISRGVGPDVLVGVCLERSCELIVGLLAVLKAGGAYMPLDPAYPQERLAFMLADAATPVLITRQALLEDLPTHQAHCVCLDRDSAQIDVHRKTNPQPALASTNRAYVIYTSGSTGTPKGVLLPQATLSHLMSWHGAHARPGRVAQLASISFDVSLQEILVSLLSGSTLFVIDDETKREPNGLSSFIQQHSITDLFVPQVLLDHLARTATECRLTLPSLKHVHQAGEALCITPAIREFFKQNPQCRLHNHYGPSESHVVTATTLPPDPALWSHKPAIGKPLPNSRIYVLDREQQPVPLGVHGELHIAGAALAIGYLNRPELTSERFVADPFSADPAARLYRTGDLARYLPDGNIDFLGRIDHQVKLRGFRIELGEIEAALMRQPQLREAVVLLREDTPGDPRLVAYVVVAGEMPTKAELRAALGQGLPGYMIPAAFVRLPALPLTASGKTDRKALPPPGDRHDPGDRSIAPRNALEALVAQIWRDLLNLAVVGIDDDFFDLGGHSLLATQAASRIQSVLHIEVPVRTMLEAPTVALLCATIAQAHPGLQVPEVPVPSIDAAPLGPDPRSMQRQAAAPTEAVALRIASPAGPLSCAQEGLWFLDGMTGPSGVYNITQAMRLSGPLNVAALERAVHALVQRHEAVRTAFESIDGVAVQSVRSLAEVAGSLRLAAMALEGNQLAEALQEAAAEPFDLACAPLLRVRLWHMGDNDHALLLVVHHIVADGWSMGILARELGALYGAFCAAQPDPLAPLPMQFADYVVWQRERLGEPSSTRDLDYWREQLAGIEPLQLPTDRARAPRSNHRGAREHVEISPATLAELKALARREKVTLFMVLLAAFQVLLMRHSGQHDVVVGSPVAGRHRTAFEGLIGYFVNTLVLRGDLSGNPRFAELLARVRLTCLQAYEHQEQPFDRLVTELRVERDLGRNPLYQVVFVLQNTPPGTLGLGDLRSEPLAVRNATAKFDLSLSLGEDGNGLSGSLEYSTQLFDAATIERLVSHFGTLLKGIAAQPGTRIEQLPLMNLQEREWLLGWSGSANTDPRQPNLHQRFEAQARRHPDAVAIAMGEASVRYAELNARANRLAHHLRTLGVGPDVLVGLCLQRSLDMIVALLAILKAGGAYVPLDPEYPSERLAFMLADTAAPVLITEQALRGQLPESGARVLCIDSDAHSFSRCPDSNPWAQATADHLAYVIYTSGSTGTPKGVMVTHRAVARLVIDTDYVQLGPDDVVAQASNSSFDAATFEIWGALLNGAKLVVVSKDVLLSGVALAREIAAHRITTLFLTTSVFNEHAANSPGMFTPLKQLLFGGEAVDPAALRRVLDTAPPGRLLNGYGPTETTTFATWFEAPLTSAEVGARVPIGRPIANTRCRVLDAQLEPVPVGIVGELYIGGPGLARGYLNRPELTAERFIDDPWLPGERLYRTGDLVRYRPDGNLDCVGRADRQVKLRGFRIELGEIEAALVACAGVRQAVVLLGTDASGTGRLVAYVVSPDGVADADALVAELKKRLPDHMIPSAIVALPALPLTPNGKLDHQALPQPGFGSGHARGDGRRSGAAAAIERVAPETPLERALAETWSEVLGVQDIGVHDDFFALGGHSLLAVRLLHAIDKALGSALHVTALFQAPTIHQLAARIEQQQLMPSSCVVAMQPHGVRKALFAIAGYGGGVRRFRTLAGVLSEDQPLYLLDTALFSQETKDFSLEDMAARMIVDMTEQQPEGPYHLIGYSLGGNIAFEMARQLRAAGVEVGLLALLDSMPSDAQPAPFLTRVWRHLQHGLALGPRGAARYLGQCAWRLRKYVISLWPQLFGGMPITLTPIEDQALASRDAVAWAWLRYRPGLYPGSMLLVRAAARSEPIKSVNGNDPELGWGAHVGGRLCLESMKCNHLGLIDPEHAGELASILHKHLELLEASQQPDVERAPRA